MIQFYKIKKFNKYKIFFVFVLFLLAILSSIDFMMVEANDNNNYFSDNLSSSTYEILKNIDFSEIQDVIDNIEGFDNFNNLDFYKSVSNILSGEYNNENSNIFQAIFSILFKNIRSILPLLFTVIGVGLVCTMVVNFHSSDGKSDIIYFVCFSIVVTLLLVSFKSILVTTESVLSQLKNQMSAIFPILITLLSSIGAITSVSIYNPIVAILTGGIAYIFSNFLFPIFIVIFLFTILNNLSSSFKLNKFIEFFNSLFKWTIGIIFTLFCGFLTIQGISAGKFDSVSIKATKFAVKSYIPIIGAYISDGMDFIVLGSVLVKNSIGLVGIFVLFVSILSPVINILILKFGLQLSSGVIELSGNCKMSNFINSCSKLLMLPIILLLGVALMYIITLCLIMCTANLF